MEDLLRPTRTFGFFLYVKEIASPFPYISTSIPFIKVLRKSVGAGVEAEGPLKRLFQESKYDMTILAKINIL